MISLRTGLLSLVILAMAAAPAMAFKKVNLQGTRSKEYMQSLCSQTGGQYLEGQGQYGCMTNCGDKSQASDACGINCSEKDNTCYGWSPAKRVTRNPKAILHPPRSALKPSSVQTR
jgi:hypothetical protein